MGSMEPQVATFEALRGRLFGLAYRMLGSKADAEDVVQDAYLRWHQARHDEVRNAEAWLVTATTRLAIDRLRALKTTRETYSGPWLPEPLLQDDRPGPDHDVTLASDLSMAFLLLLERLAPEERAAFLLHEVFEARYGDIARILGRSEAATRQVVHRARERVRGDRQRFEASDEARGQLLETFTAAMQVRDEAALLRLFTSDVTWVSDGGGVVHAAPYPIVGANRVVALVLGLQRLYGRHGAVLEPARVNGEAGLVLRVDNRIMATFAVAVEGDRIAAIYLVINPHKLPVQ